jgi:hypothetical protein
MNDESKNPDMIPWSVNSWKTFKISQQPIYKDTDLLNNIKNKVFINFLIQRFHLFLLSLIIKKS